MTEPPIKMVHHGRFHTGADASFADEPRRRTYRQTARRVAFRALSRGKLAAELVHIFRTIPATNEHQVTGGWLIADASGNTTAHRGHYAGQGGPWDLADAIIPGSAGAVQRPALNGCYCDRPDAFRELVERHEAALQQLLARHGDAIEAGHLFGTMQTHADPCFLALLKSAIDDRTTQLVLHDWLAERGFPHVDELRLKRWYQGKWTEIQLLDLLSKPFTTTRRSFSGAAIS
jgi:hypothetical protein